LNLVLAGQSDGVSTVTSDLTLNFLVLAGQSDGTSTATGTLAGTVGLAGGSDGSSTVTADMILNLVLAGGSDGVSTATADLIVGALVALAGQSDGLSNVIGLLTDFVQEGLVSVRVQSVLDHKGREKTRVIVRSR